MRTRHDSQRERIHARPDTALAAAAVTEILDSEHMVPDAVPSADPVIRHDMVATAAYYIAEQRGFEPGHEVEDWLVAEQMVDAGLRRAGSDH